MPATPDDGELAEQLYEASLDLAVTGHTIADAAERIVVLALGRTTATDMALQRAETAAMDSPVSLVRRRAFSQLARASLNRAPAPDTSPTRRGVR